MSGPSPVIGISSNVGNIEQGPFAGNKRYFVNSGYVESVVNAGGIPLILPPTTHPEIILSLVHGLIISGGHDVQPHLYAEEPHALLEETSNERDAFELELMRQAHQRKIPILGICRGMQLMNVAFEGSLYQDLSLNPQTQLDHRPNEGEPIPNHLIELTPGTFLSDIFQTKSILVNSVHHQAIKKLSPHFTIAALSQDGVIEGIASNNGWMIGVQWHPEIRDGQMEMDPLFSALIHQASLYPGKL